MKYRLILTGAAATLIMNAILLANGGPFLLKYPEGDPSGKGVLARLDGDLKPARESRLRVVSEDLKVTFRQAAIHGAVPLARVSAEYTISNPTPEPVEIDFGFPILSGVYRAPESMGIRPDVNVLFGTQSLPVTIISNSVIYGIIRQRARGHIDEQIAASPQLAALVNGFRTAQADEMGRAEEALTRYLSAELKWNQRDAALLLEYCRLDLGLATVHPHDRENGWWWRLDQSDAAIVSGNLGVLGAIGEQKATQYLAHLAGCFDPAVATQYEDIFHAWGGNITDLAFDIATGKVRPRKFDIADKDEAALVRMMGSDPTVYARIDYFEERADMPEAQKAACKTILKNLPVIFTFAPMNILHYRARFEPGVTEKLTVSYSQYAFEDTQEPATFQLAYVVHPASMWESFGPINLRATVPSGVRFNCSAACTKTDAAEGVLHDIYAGVIKDKTGCIYLAMDQDSWRVKIAEVSRKAQ